MASPPDSVSSGLDGSSEGASSVPSQGPSLGDQATIQGGRAGARTFSPGQVVADRYRIVGSLGEGGMGEVWHAFDLKLRVDVALKTLLFGSIANESRIEALRREVRSARDVVSPNVCRVFDLEVVDDQELVSMEFVDGETLIDVLRSRGPLDLGEAREIASQFLAGLSAIHDAGLVHRDIKPENIMITRAGRVVIMDFGLAKLETEGSHGTVSGTPAYMPPEQRRGEAVDARADIFAAGVVLAEMLATDKADPIESRKSLLTGIHHVPPRLPDSPWRGVLTRAVSIEPEGRYRSASALARALEEVTLRVEGVEDRKPYPGLSSFTEDDTQYFFGREAEVEALWAKLQHPQLLALIGPSGAGKSSFLRAGLIAHKPEGWKHVICHPGDAPFRALAKAMVPELAGDTEATEALIGFDDVDTAVGVFRRWRPEWGSALLIVDQFEELFTLNPPETQQRFADLIGRLPIEANLHVLISMRDDFLLRCKSHASLQPVFSELTALIAPTGSALRRALVQPALACGYRFEDDPLVDEMLSEVSDEHGALPLVAFAASRLWETRDRDQGILTRSAYEEIGGVAGALAQHAEATMERLGEGRKDTVREIFRNLVTAEGTRAVRQMDELLSVFENREAARDVLNALIDARLLTSYEVTGVDDEEPRHQVEIVHESLLDAWPRLVRWRTQDEDSAQLRDQLRQAAKLWEERDRSEDLLWSGSAYFDYRAWRERYPGGLSDTEEAFAEAMVSKANRQRRRRRIAMGFVFGLLITILVTVGTLWKRAASALQEAEVAQSATEAALSVSEANRLVALGRLRELDRNPSAAIGYAIASLELANTREARLLALEALWRGPPARAAPLRNEESTVGGWSVAFSSDCRWLAAGRDDGTVMVYESNGERRASWVAHEGTVRWIFFGPRSRSLMTSAITGGTRFVEARLWSVPQGELLLESRGALPFGFAFPPRKGLVTLFFEGGDAVVLQTPFEGASDRTVARFRPTEASDRAAWLRSAGIDPDVRWLVTANGRRVFVRSLEDVVAKPRFLGTHPANVVKATVGGSVGITADQRGTIRMWNLISGELIRSFPGLEAPTHMVRYPELNRLWIRTSSGSARLWSFTGDETVSRAFELGSGVMWTTLDDRFDRVATADLDNLTRVWSLAESDEVPPLELRRGAVRQVNSADFCQGNDWLATTDLDAIALWWLASPRSRELWRHTGELGYVRFARNGSWLVASGQDSVRIWDLNDRSKASDQILAGDDIYLDLDMDPSGQWLLVGSDRGQPRLVPLEGSESFSLSGFRSQVRHVAISTDGSLVAGGGAFDPTEAVIRVWDSSSKREVALLDADDQKWINGLAFAADGGLFSASESGIRRWDLSAGTFDVIRSGPSGAMALSNDSSELVVINGENAAVVMSLRTREERELSNHGHDVTAVAIASSGDFVVTGDSEGVVRVGRTDGSPPHLLLGHSGLVESVAIDPAGRWIASISEDRTVRLWPMPDLSRSPFHELPRNELLEKLRALTNYRVVQDESDTSGYHITLDRFPGWETVPEWW